MASQTIDRRTRVIMNLKANKPSIMAMKFADFHAAQAAEAAGEEYTRKPPFTIILLRQPVDLAFLKWFLRHKLSESEYLNDEADAQEVAEQEETELQVEKLENGAEYVRVKGNRRWWWNELCGLFGNGEDAVWYMKDIRVTIGEEKYVEVLEAVRHFPEEKMDGMRRRRSWRD